MIFSHSRRMMRDARSNQSVKCVSGALAWPGVLYSLRAVDLAAGTPQVDGPSEPWPANAYQNEEKTDPHVLRKNADSHHDHRGPEQDQQDGRHRDDEAYAVAASICFAHK